MGKKINKIVDDNLIEKLNFLKVSDIFYGESGNGAILICVVTRLDDNKIYSRRITTQDDCVFDRKTGLANRNPGESEAIITSVEPLPAEIYQILIGLDRRYRAGEDAKLTTDEKRALLFR